MSSHPESCQPAAPAQPAAQSKLMHSSSLQTMELMKHRPVHKLINAGELAPRLESPKTCVATCPAKLLTPAVWRCRGDAAAEDSPRSPRSVSEPQQQSAAALLTLWSAVLPAWRSAAIASKPSWAIIPPASAETGELLTCCACSCWSVAASLISLLPDCLLLPVSSAAGKIVADVPARQASRLRSGPHAEAADASAQASSAADEQAPSRPALATATSAPSPEASTASVPDDPLQAPRSMHRTTASASQVRLTPLLAGGVLTVSTASPWV